jgi:beta-1,4-mannooligosaccharide/beta-1,4-mannosyl-N-acetylglucosamine phosphorylase
VKGGSHRREGNRSLQRDRKDQGEDLPSLDACIPQLDDAHYIMFALDRDSGCQLGVGGTKDFVSFEFLGIASTEDIRNGVLFPERIGGTYLRMDRPNKERLEGGPMTGSPIWLSESDDLIHWRVRSQLVTGRFHY